MTGSTEYQCGECRHSFRVPEGTARDTRMLMCPACGSIDLNLVTTRRRPAAVWTSREATPAAEPADQRTKLAS